MSSYNYIPYRSSPIAQTQLSYLAALGFLHGVDAPAPEHCRVFEIGCAEANNLIPMAQRWPNSTFFGIDLSPVQIASGHVLIERLELENIRLEAKDILELQPQDLGTFDYIIVHGVYSWVPEHVQQHILHIIQQCLSPQGLAYISYNTYPGWHTQAVLRDVLRLYCQPEPQSGAEKSSRHELEHFALKQNRLNHAITYFKDFFRSAPNSFSHYYAKELDSFSSYHDAYIYHEYLESYNQPIYFKDFISGVKPYQLKYVCDTYLPIDTPFLFGAKVRHLLERFEDRIERSQYLDFLLNQRFRRSLLCHQNLKVEESFGPLQLTQLAFRGRLRARSALKLKSERKQRFYQSDKPQYHITLKHPVGKAAMQILAEHYPSSLAYADLLQQACQRVAEKGGEQFLHALEPFYNELYLLFADNWIQIEHKAHQISPIDWSQALTIDALSFETVQQYGYLPTALHDAIDVKKFDSTVLRLLRQGMTRENLWQTLKQQRFAPYTGWRALKRYSPLQHYDLRKRLYLFLEMLRENGVLKNTRQLS